MAAVDYPDLQLVMVDDASDDGTPDVLERLAEELPLTLIRLADNLGRKGALVRACAVADGARSADTAVHSAPTPACWPASRTSGARASSASARPPWPPSAR
ncbi:glycosyltransferase [Streptomyces tendae]|uniref:glycosyltransferase n=1 Tax=Streptomyces tendae TaxID=1932 RepID=UPI00380291DD